MPNRACWPGSGHEGANHWSISDRDAGREALICTGRTCEGEALETVGDVDRNEKTVQDARTTGQQF